MSINSGIMSNDRELCSSAHLLKGTSNLGLSEVDMDAVDRQMQFDTVGKFEPDWRRFEAVFARELLPYHDDNVGLKEGKTSLKNATKSEFKAQPSHVKTTQFLTAVVDLLLDYIRRSNDRRCKVLDFHHPNTLREMMSHCLDIPDQPQDLEQILSDCRETLKYCVKTGHPRFFNQLSTGLDIISLAGEWLTATSNTNMFTYEIAPVFTLIEDVVMTKMREYVGWPDGDGDGIFAPGGSISNLYAIAVARYKALPQSKAQGMTTAPRMVLFTSEQSHFSIKRAAAVLGIGTDNVILIATDSRGRMLVSDLDAKISQAKVDGALPFFVSATAGTTVLGAFDPLNDVADVCTKHGLWFHVDGAWGGSALLSNKYRHLLDGVHRADSVTWNPHKLMGALLQCSAILVREKGLMEACNSSNATYLFQQDKHYDLAYDTGDKAIQCGRHNDVFKLWLAWRARGEAGFGNRIDRLMDLSKYFQRQVAAREGFEFVLEDPDFINVCFWYVPKNLRSLSRGTERDERLGKVAPKIKAKMMEKGSTMVGYQPLKNKPNFFRMIISNPATNTTDLDFLLDEIEKLGEEQ